MCSCGDCSILVDFVPDVLSGLDSSLGSGPLPMVDTSGDFAADGDSFITDSSNLFSIPGKSRRKRKKRKGKVVDLDCHLLNGVSSVVGGHSGFPFFGCCSSSSVVDNPTVFSGGLSFVGGLYVYLGTISSYVAFLYGTLVCVNSCSRQTSQGS